jgi:putative ABC transport system substrate-binding protein
VGNGSKSASSIAGKISLIAAAVASGVAPLARSVAMRTQLCPFRGSSLNRYDDLAPKNPAEEPETKDAKAAALALGLRLEVLNATSERDIDAAFTTLPERRIGALVVGSDPLFLGSPHKLVELAARHAVPAIYNVREFAEAGGLMSYGSRQSDAYHQAGIYVGKILQGAKPADLPVMQPSKFEFVVQ